MLLEGQFGRLEDGECRHLLESVARFGIRRAREGSGTTATGNLGSFCLLFFFFRINRFASHGRREKDRATRCVRKHAVASEIETPKDSKNRLKNPSRKSNGDGFREGGERPQLPMGKPSGESNCRQNPMKRLTAKISSPIVLPGKRTDGDENVVDLDRLSSAKKKTFGDVR